MYLGGIMMVPAVILAVVLTVVTKAIGAGTDAAIADLPREQALLIGGLNLGLVLASIVLGLVGLILDFVGIIQAKKDDSHFNTAFFTALLSIVISFIVSFLLRNKAEIEYNPVIRQWLSLGGTVCSILTHVFILSGIASLAAKMADGKSKAMAEKARVIVCALSIGSAAASLIAAYLTGAILLIFVDYGLSIGSTIYYLTVLAKARKMLAG